jgi:hypothetical protein
MSTDKTEAEILRFMKREKDNPGLTITYELYGFAPDQATLRNRYLEIIKEEKLETDILLMIDGDELYKGSDLRNMAALVMSQPSFNAFTVTHWYFWGSPFRVKQVPESDAMYAVKVFRYDPTWKYHPPESVDIRCDSGMKLLRTPYINMYHMGYVRDKILLLNKFYWTYKRHMEAGRCLELSHLSEEELLSYLLKNEPLLSTDEETREKHTFVFHGNLPFEIDVLDRYYGHICKGVCE